LYGSLDGGAPVTDAVANHIGLCVHDIDRSRRFYEELLGFEYQREIAPPDDITGRLLQLEPPAPERAFIHRRLAQMTATG